MRPTRMWAGAVVKFRDRAGSWFTEIARAMQE